MLSTPSPLSLCLRCLPLPYCPWPEGTVGFLNALPPFVSTHWLALCSPKSRAAWGAGCSFLLVLLQKKNLKEKKKRRGVANHQEFTTTCRGMSVLSVCLSCSNENQLGLSQFPLCVAVVVSSVCRALSSSSSSSSLHCWFSPSCAILFVDPLCSVCSAVTQVTHNPTQQTP